MNEHLSNLILVVTESNIQGRLNLMVSPPLRVLLISILEKEISKRSKRDGSVAHSLIASQKVSSFLFFCRSLSFPAAKGADGLATYNLNAVKVPKGEFFSFSSLVSAKEKDTQVIWLIGVSLTG